MLPPVDSVPSARTPNAALFEICELRIATLMFGVPVGWMKTPPPEPED